MSDRDAAPDPIDEAVRRAEAVLEDDAARAARRARVLGAVAVASEPAPAPPAVRRRIWRGGGALMAASVAGLALLVTLQQRQAGPRPSSPALQPEAPRPIPPQNGPATLPSPDAGPATSGEAEPMPRPARAAPPPAPSRVPQAARPSSAPAVVTDVPAIPPLPVPPVQQLIPPLPVPPVQQRIPPVAAPAGPAQPGQPRIEAAPLGGPVVTGSPAPRAFPLGESSASEGRVATRAAVAEEAAARLGSAAFAGRVREVRALLAEGVPVDAVDADGETALMKSIRGGRPAVAALLLARGASLDRENRQGQSARDLAAERRDPRLDAALGLSR